MDDLLIFRAKESNRKGKKICQCQSSHDFFICSFVLSTIISILCSLMKSKNISILVFSIRVSGKGLDFPFITAQGERLLSFDWGFVFDYFIIFSYLVL